jgi:predicted secreted hydrolase
MVLHMLPKHPLHFQRRALLLAGLAASSGASALPEKKPTFPRDFGSHPEFRTERWAVAGHAKSGDREFGFEVAFFRSRVDVAQSVKSKLAAKQLIFAQGAITDVQSKKLLQDQRVARGGVDIAIASTTDMDIQVKDWSLKRSGDGYAVQLAGSDKGNAFKLALSLKPVQKVLLQGVDGLSQRGPDDKNASYYYSEPQLKTQGVISVGGKNLAIEGTAWLDHEWSEEPPHPDIVGWDWIGMNLFDGGALTAFRLRDAKDRSFWGGGSLRAPDGRSFPFTPNAAKFSVQSTWKSPLSQAVYPVQWTVRMPTEFYTVKAVIHNQELDCRASSGAMYWEGLSDLFDGAGRHIGRGYLEMTGYAKALRL